MSFIGYLKTVCRLPVRTIQSLLKSLYGLSLWVGAIMDILHAIAECGAHTVPKVVLGSAYPGIIVSDFYGGYTYLLGLHQRCWVHFLRDLHDLKAKDPHDTNVHAWAAQVRQVFDEACAFSSDKQKERVCARERFQRLVALAKPYVKKELPQRLLAGRIIKFEPELFQFVEHPQVPPDNNAAERSLRSSVITRKISGGTRWAKGSHTKSVLMSLFGTSNAQGISALEACKQLLVENTLTINPSHQV